MRVHVKVVGPLRQYVEKSEGEWDLPEDTTIEQLLDPMGFPEKIKKMPIMTVVNNKFTGCSTKLKDGDEIKLLWPVGGG
ncbi:MAG: MoaD/ThiS family protein [Actinomycetia bacterium]|nr:MoaD/ThiS family protein [Actinomycetes bacterium]